VRSHAPLVPARMETINNTPFERFRDVARGGPDRPLDKSKKRTCADYGPQAHFRRVNPDGSTEYIAAPCDRWSCDRCAPSLRAHLVEEIHRAVTQHGLNQLLTLTIRHDTDPRPGYYARKLLRKWRALRDLYAKQFKVRLPFVWLKQVEKDWPHLHVFTCGLDLAWVTSQWKSRTGAYELDLQAIDQSTMPGPASYAARQIHDNASTYKRSCGRWWGASADIHLTVRQRGRGNGQWQRYDGPLELKALGLAEGECAEIQRDDRGVYLEYVRTKPKGDVHADA
jgi:hypothetical protein